MKLTISKIALTLQASLLAHIFVIVLEDRVQGPLWKPEDGSFPSNKEFLKQHLSFLLHNEFNQLTLFVFLHFFLFSTCN